jgi:coenzyme F420-reducing hydrogenase gamma subunit
MSPEPTNQEAAPAKKVRVGWFSYSCCEDSTIVFTEILNDHWQEWKKILHFVHARVLQANNKWEQMDVAFIEGACAGEKQAEEIRKIRGLATKVVAIGACACTGMPSAMRNNFPESLKKEIQPLLEEYHHADKVLKLADVIKVDYEVPGCPMDPKNFVAVLQKALADLQAAG